MAKDSFGGLGGMMVPALDLERSDRKMRELMAKIPAIWETQARMYMEGLKAQAEIIRLNADSIGES